MLARHGDPAANLIVVLRGEVTAETSTGLSIPKQTYSYNKLSQVSGVNGATIGYDTAGNLTRVPGGAELAYNADDEVTSLTKGASTATYTYNKDGSRITSKGATATTYSYNQAQELSGYTVGATSASYA